MAPLWPWLAVAGLGALHGLSPANGWMFAATCGVRAGDAVQARRALRPIACGHVASVALVACAVAQGMAVDRALVQALAGALLVGAAVFRVLGGAARSMPASTQARHTGIALWSFLMATANGAGLMLVPALVPLCIGESPAREITASGSMLLALAAVAVHTAAMLVTTGVVATGVCRGLVLPPRLLSAVTQRQAGTAALGITGMLLIALRPSA